MQEKPWDVLPPIFLEHLKELVPSGQIDNVLSTFAKEKPITFRTNTVKITTKELERTLHAKGINFKKVPWYPDAFILDPVIPKSVLVESEFVKEGLIYIQGLSSMIPPLLLDPKEDELICDLTAAPGSKTSQMAMLMRNTGKIVANDISRSRMYKLKDNLATQGVINTESSIFPGQALWKRYPEQFDKTLVDVPCTLEGRFSALDPQTYADWKPKKIKILSQLQKFLLRSAVALTKPGGIIIYSTCTFEPEENESVVEWVLQKEGKALQVESFDLSVGDFQEGLTAWHKKQFNASLKKTRRVLPSTIMEGFYVAKIKKLSSTLPV